MPQFIHLPPSSLQPSPHNPRYDTQDHLELEASVARVGILQPIIVTPPDATGTYTIVAGERRWRAAVSIGLETVPCLVMDPASSDLFHVLLMQVSENAVRVPLSVIDEAVALRFLWLLANAQEAGIPAPSIPKPDESESSISSLITATRALESTLRSAGILSDPPVSYESFLRTSGLAITTANLRKKFELVRLPSDVIEWASRAKIRTPALRALVRLPPVITRTLARIVEHHPRLSEEIRTMVQSLTTKQRCLGDTVLIALGIFPGTSDAAAMTEALGLTPELYNLRVRDLRPDAELPTDVRTSPTSDPAPDDDAADSDDDAADSDDDAPDLPGGGGNRAVLPDLPGGGGNRAVPPEPPGGGGNRAVPPESARMADEWVSIQVPSVAMGAISRIFRRWGQLSPSEKQAIVYRLAIFADRVLHGDTDEEGEEGTLLES